MRLLRLQIQHFGPLTHFDTGESRRLPSLVAVLGPNEAGKSTLREAVLSLLFGFYPATRDGNPLAPWSGESPELRGWLQVGDGPELQIHRRLLSRPDGQLHREDSVSDIRNQELPQVRHLRKEVFEQVYAVTLPDLANLKHEGWQAIQDRLVVGMGTQDLTPPREAVAALQSRADSLWRPDRRGKPRHGELLGEIRTLQESVREARSTDQRLRELHQIIPDLRSRLQNLRAQESERKEQIRKINRLLPLLGRLRHLKDLAHEAGPASELEALPADPEATLSTLEERLHELQGRKERLERELSRARELATGLTKAEASVLDSREDLRALADQIPLFRERATERGRLEGDRARLARRVAKLQAPLIPAGDSLDPNAIRELPTDRLHELVRELERQRRQILSLNDALEEVNDRAIPQAPHAPSSSTRAGLAAGILLVLVGAVLGWLLPGDFPGLAIFLVLLGTGAAAWSGSQYLRWRTRAELQDEALRLQRQDIERLERRITELQGEAAQTKQRLGDLLAPLSLRTQVLDDPPPSLVQDLERLRDLFLDRADMDERLGELEAQENRIAEALRQCRNEHTALADLPPDPLKALPELARRLDDLQTRSDTAKGAERELERLLDESDRLEKEIESVKRRHGTLVQAIRRAGGEETLEQALAEAVARLEASRNRGRIREELQRERPQLAQEEEELEVARQAGEPWLEDPDTVARLEEERSELSQQREEVRGELERALEEARNLSSRDTVDVIEGRILALREEMGHLARERDRLFVLGRLIQVAEHRFRQEHQPDLLRRAGGHLARITQGRYPRFILSDSSRDEPFALDAPHLPRPLAVDTPLSTGTREQAYLALRLAIVDHLDEGRAPLPLFLDEILVNWDPKRRGAGLDLLTHLSGTRQVFLFTCDPGLAGAVEQRGGQIVQLPSPETRT